jgi:hypothetical protein
MADEIPEFWFYTEDGKERKATLQQLIDAGLVSLNRDRYELTSSGKERLGQDGYLRETEYNCPNTSTDCTFSRNNPNFYERNTSSKEFSLKCYCGDKSIKWCYEFEFDKAFVRCDKHRIIRCSHK